MAPNPTAEPGSNQLTVPGLALPNRSTIRAFPSHRV